MVGLEGEREGVEVVAVDVVVGSVMDKTFGIAIEIVVGLVVGVVDVLFLFLILVWAFGIVLVVVVVVVVVVEVVALFFLSSLVLLEVFFRAEKRG